MTIINCTYSVPSLFASTNIFVLQEMHNTTHALEKGLDINKENWEEVVKQGLPDHNTHYIRQQQSREAARPQHSLHQTTAE